MQPFYGQENYDSNSKNLSVRGRNSLLGLGSSTAPQSSLDLKADSNTISRKLTTLNEIKKLK